MPLVLLKMAHERGIIVEYWDFPPPLEAVYWTFPELPPVIGLAKSLFQSRPRFRCVLAEELGHHFMTVGDAIPKTHFCYHDRLKITRAEHKALRWAALHLVPLDKLHQAFSEGVQERWRLANYFDVTEDMMNFRLRLPDMFQCKVI